MKKKKEEKEDAFAERPSHTKNQFKKYKEEIKKYKPKETLLDYATSWDTESNEKNAEYNKAHGIDGTRDDHKIFISAYDHLSTQTVKNDMQEIIV